jgi:hypothetical protein
VVEGVAQILLLTPEVTEVLEVAGVITLREQGVLAILHPQAHLKVITEEMEMETFQIMRVVEAVVLLLSE